MALNLGTVTFNLNANYQGIINALNYVKQSSTQFAQINQAMQQQAKATGVAFSAWSPAISNANNATNSFVTTLKQLHAVVSAVAGPLSHTANMISQFSTLTNVVGGAAAGAIAGVTALGLGVYKLGESVVQAGIEWQKLVGILTSATGSGYIAERQLKALMDVSMATGTNFDKAAEEFGRFEAAVLGAGGSAKEAMSAFKGVTDEVAALRLPSENTAHALLALQQMMSAGKVQGQELRQLYNALPGSLNLMAKGLGITTQQLREQAKTGLDATKAVTAFGDELQKAFAGPAALNAQTLTGAMENLHTAWLKFMVDIEQKLHLLEFLAAIVNKLIYLVDELRAAFDRLHGTPFAAMVQDAEAGKNAIQAFLDATKGMTVSKNTLAMYADDAAQRMGELKGQIKTVEAEYDRLVKAAADPSLLNQVRGVFGRGPGDVAGTVLTELTVLNRDLAKTTAQYAELQERMKTAPTETTSLGGLNAAQLEKQADAIEKAKMEIADLNKEYTAILTKSPAAYLQEQAAATVDKQVDAMRQSLEAAKVPLKEINTLVMQYKAGLTGLTLIKPAIPIIQEIDKQKDILADASAGVLKYAQYFDQLKDLPTQALMRIAAELGIAYTNTKDLAMAMDDLTEKAKRATELEKAYENVNNKIKEMDYEMKILSGDTAKAHTYMKDPALFKSLQDYYEYLVDVEHKSNEQAQAAVDGYTKQARALQKLKDQAAVTFTASEIMADSLTAGFNQLGSEIENVFMKGKITAQSFLDVLENVLQTIMNVILEEALFKPIGQAISAGINPSAKGIVMANDNIVPMAKGEILYRPTIFPLQGGAAIASEYGQAEAVMPLKRTSSGDLGVAVAGGAGGTVINVNVINNAAPDVQTQTRQSKNGRGEIDLEILVSKVVSKDIRSGGPVAQSIGTMFSSSQRVVSR